MKVNAKKALLLFAAVAAVFALGFAGGIVASRMAAGGSPNEIKAPQAKAYPILPLGEFTVSLVGGEFSDSRLANFDLVLELENDKILEKLNADEYWVTLFRNEIIAECMSRGAEAFRSPEAVLKLSEAITERLNAVSPSAGDVEFPIRRVLFKSIILQ